MQPWRRRDNLILCTAVCGRVVFGPLAVAAGRLLAAAEVDGLHSFNTAGLAELQGLDLRMDCREEQRYYSELHGCRCGVDGVPRVASCMDAGVTGGPELMRWCNGMLLTQSSASQGWAATLMI